MLILLILLSACNRHDEEIKVYRLVKPSGETAVAQAESIASTNVPVRPEGEQAPPVADAMVPPNWEPQPLSQMRQASFLVHGENGAVADISFVTLGPAAGNVLDNVNRWLGQLSQPPITAEELASMVQKLSTSMGEISVVDLTGKPEENDGKKDGRILAAIGSGTAGTAFYKMRGNVALVGAEKENFLRWVSSSRHANGAASTTVTTQAPTDSATPKIKWALPEGWAEVPPSSMRYASFSAPDPGGGKIDISIVTFPGEGGSDIDNVNRWRQQIGLSPMDANALNEGVIPLKTEQNSFSTIDIAGTSSRTVAAWTRRDGRVWFFKATGPNAAIEAEKAKFFDFVRSIRFNS